VNKGHSILSSLSYVGGSEVVARIAHFITFALCTRYLGPAGFGIYGTAWALYSMALPIVQGGPELLGVGLLASGDAGNKTDIAITSLKLALTLCVIPILMVAAFFFYTHEPMIVAQVFAQSLVLFGIAISPAWIARGRQRFDLHAWNRIAQAILMTVTVFVFVSVIPRPIVVTIAELGSFLFAFWITARALRVRTTTGSSWFFSVLPSTVRQITDALRNYARPSLALGLSGLASAIQATVCIPIAGYFLSAEETGIVSAVVRLLIFMFAQFQVLLQVFYPRLAEHYTSDARRGQDLVGDLFVYFSILSAVAALALAMLAGPMVRLILGDAYLPAIPLLWLLAPMLFIVGAGCVFGYALLAAGKHLEFAITNIGAAIVQVIAALLAYSVFPTPIATVVLIPVTLAQVGAQIFLCQRHGLLRMRLFSFHRFSPSYLAAFLKS
jgi:O-antigen/teichoic acid export membrane protein